MTPDFKLTDREIAALAHDVGMDATPFIDPETWDGGHELMRMHALLDAYIAMVLFEINRKELESE